MKHLLFWLTCLWLGSCSSITAHADFEEGLDFSTFETFFLAAPPTTAPVGLPGYSEIRGREINARLAQALEGKGYLRSDEEQADLVISFSLAGELREDVRSSGSVSMGVTRYHGWYGANWYEPNLYTVSYVRGTLVVDAFDRARERIVWHGWSSVSVYSESDAASKVDEVVTAVMERFPAR
jgi:hypothetical protein